MHYARPVGLGRRPSAGDNRDFTACAGDPRDFAGFSVARVRCDRIIAMGNVLAVYSSNLSGIELSVGF